MMMGGVSPVQNKGFSRNDHDICLISLCNKNNVVVSEVHQPFHINKIFVISCAALKYLAIFLFCIVWATQSIFISKKM